MSESFGSSGPTITVRAAFGSDALAASPSWTDITDYVRAVDVGGGRSDWLSTFGARTAMVRLSNADRRFDPEYADGPYYGNLVPRVRINVRATYSAVTYDLFTGWADGWPQAYIQNSDSVVDLTATDGFKFLDRRLPSSAYAMAVAADKPDHWWKLDEPSGTVAFDSGFAGTKYDGQYIGNPTLGVDGIVPYDGSRTCATFSTSNYVQFNANLLASVDDYAFEGWFKHDTIGGLSDTLYWTGSNHYAEINTSVTGQLIAYIAGTSFASGVRVDDNAVHHFAVVRNGTTGYLYLDGAQVATGAVSTAAFTGSTPVIGHPNGLGIVQSFNGTVASLVFWNGTTLSSTQVAAHYNAGKTASEGVATGTRVGQVLDYIGYPSALRAIDTGNSTLIAHEPSGTAKGYIDLLAQAEQGAFYFLGDGTANFRQRHALLQESAYTTANGTFGDSGSELKYSDLRTSYDDTDLGNEATVTTSAGRQGFAADTDSIDLYGPASAPTGTSLPIGPNDAQAQAEWVVSRRKDPGLRIRSLDVKPRRDPTALWPKILGARLEYRYTVKRRPQGVGDAIEADVLVQDLRHSFAASPRSWVTTAVFAPAQQATNVLVYDDATAGVYDDIYVYGY